MRKISYADSGDDGRFEHRATYTHAIEEKADEVEHDSKRAINVFGHQLDVAAATLWYRDANGIEIRIEVIDGLHDG